MLNANFATRKMVKNWQRTIVLATAQLSNLIQVELITKFSRNEFLERAKYWCSLVRLVTQLLYG